jgi:hypothetical protein
MLPTLNFFRGDTYRTLGLRVYLKDDGYFSLFYFRYNFGISLKSAGEGIRTPELLRGQILSFALLRLAPLTWLGYPRR